MDKYKIQQITYLEIKEIFDSFSEQEKDFYNPDSSMNEESFWKKNSSNNAIGIKFNNHVIAFLEIDFRIEQNINGKFHKALTFGLGVHHDFRQKGIGTKLLKFLDFLAKKTNCKIIFVHTNQNNNPMINMLKKNNYKLNLDGKSRENFYFRKEII